jgi:hypothetical protein
MLSRAGQPQLRLTAFASKSRIAMRLFDRPPGQT